MPSLLASIVETALRLCPEIIRRYTGSHVRHLHDLEQTRVAFRGKVCKDGESTAQ